MLKKISIIIPCYEMYGMGSVFLDFLFQSLKNQTFKNFNIIISDNSVDNNIKDLCKSYSPDLEIKYLDNSKQINKTSSTNLNFALDYVDKDIAYIKFLFQDDFLYNESSLQDIFDEFESNSEKNWLISSCCHYSEKFGIFNFMEPYYYDKIYLGEPNSISSPSVLTIKNKNIIKFDENLQWLMDVDYYKMLYLKFGEPIILKKTTCVNRLWENKVDNILNPEIKEFEINYIKNKYKKEENE